MRLATVVTIGLMGFAAPWLIVGAQYDGEANLPQDPNAAVVSEADVEIQQRAQAAGAQQLRTPRTTMSPYADQQSSPFVPTVETLP